MFHRTWEWIKTHPLMLAGIFGGFVILYLIYKVAGGGSSDGTTVNYSQAGPSDATVQAGAAVSIAQLQGQAAATQTQAQLAAEQNSNATAVSIATLQAQVANYQVEQQANVQSLGITEQAAIQQAGITSQQAITLGGYATQAQIASVNADVQKTKINAIENIYDAPYQLQEAQLTALGPGGLADVIHWANSVKNSYVNIGGISAGRNSPQSTSGNAIAAAAGSAVQGIGAMLAFL